MSLTNNDLKTLVEYVNQKDNSVKNELTESLNTFRDTLMESVSKHIAKELQSEDVLDTAVTKIMRTAMIHMAEDTRFRGPVGYQGQEGPRGDRGDRGPMGKVPNVDIDRDSHQIRFEVGSYLNEDTGASTTLYSDWIKLPSGPAGAHGARGPMGKTPVVQVSENKKSIRFEVGTYLNEATGEAAPMYSDWIELPSGPAGEKGDALTFRDLTKTQIEEITGPQGPVGAKGEPGRFPLVESDTANRRVRFQISEDVSNPWSDWFVVPEGPSGPQGALGRTPHVQIDEETQSVRFEIGTYLNEDTNEEVTQYTNWMNISGPRGMLGEQGPRGNEGPRGLDADPRDVAERILENRDFLVMTKGERGEPGQDGRDAEVDYDVIKTNINEAINISIKDVQADVGNALAKKIEKTEQVISKKFVDMKNKVEKTNVEMNNKVEREVGRLDQKIINTETILRSDFSNRINDIVGSKMSEMIVPTGPFDGFVAENGESRAVYVHLPTMGSGGIVSGSPVYVDNTIKASIRGETYDSDNWLVYADASSMLQAADGMVVVREGKVYLYKTGIIEITDPRIIENSDVLIPGEYYYLAHPAPYQNQSEIFGRITPNYPQFGIAQIMGQALSETEFFVNIQHTPIELGKTVMKLQGAYAAHYAAPVSSKGTPGDNFGDVNIDDTYLYICNAEYDGINDIWRRIRYTDSTW